MTCHICGDGVLMIKSLDARRMQDLVLVHGEGHI